jgi:hypothetical protein
VLWNPRAWRALMEFICWSVIRWRPPPSQVENETQSWERDLFTTCIIIYIPYTTCAKRKTEGREKGLSGLAHVTVEHLSLVPASWYATRRVVGTAHLNVPLHKRKRATLLTTTLIREGRGPRFETHHDTLKRPCAITRAYIWLLRRAYNVWWPVGVELVIDRTKCQSCEFWLFFVSKHFG